MKLLFLLFGLTSFKLDAEQKIRHLYLTYQNDPTSTITVNIHGIKTPSDLIIYYDTQKHHSQILQYPYGVNAKGRKIDGLPENRKIYHAELSDLKPNTIYYLSVGDRTQAFLSEEIAFKTFPQSKSPLLLIEGGDWENTPASEALAKKAASLRPSAVLLGGDYSSFATHILDYQQWDKWLDVYTKTMKTPEGLLIPMVMAVGNHEVSGGFGKTKADIPFLLNYFRQNSQTYFSLPLGDDRHLFVLDSGHAASHDGLQKKWLEDELKKNAHKKVKMALYHVPLYPSIHFFKKNFFYYTTYGFLSILQQRLNADKLFSKETVEGRKHWLPLFDKYGMTVAFEHHDQTLKRTKLLRNDHEDPKGTLYLGDGGFGPEYQYLPIQKYLQSHFVFLLGKVHFFWVVLIEQDKVSYAAVTASGQILDRFTQKLP